MPATVYVFNELPDPNDFDKVVRKRRCVSHVHELCRADNVDCTLIQLPPVAEGCDDNARIDVGRDPGDTFEGAAVVMNLDRVVFTNGTCLSILRVDQYELFTRPLIF